LDRARAPGAGAVSIIATDIPTDIPIDAPGWDLCSRSKHDAEGYDAVRSVT
jgi:hypothetical protein